MGQHSNIVATRPNYKIQANADYNVRRKTSTHSIDYKEPILHYHNTADIITTKHKMAKKKLPVAKKHQLTRTFIAS